MDHLLWRDCGRLLAPDPARPFAARAVKDPSIVYAEGQWHLFYTAVGSDGARSLGYARAPRLEDLTHSPSTPLCFDYARFAHTREGAAPFVVFYEPQRLWYLIFQIPTPQRGSYIPVYVTNPTLDPAAWSAPRSLLPPAAPLEKRRIDFWLIADQQEVYLYYWDNAGGTWCLTCAREHFPHGFAHERLLFTLVTPTWEIHEGGCVYWVSDQQLYLMLVEAAPARRHAGRVVFPQAGQARFYVALTARDLRGPWYVVEQPIFARPEDVQMQGGQRWIHNVSHGEVIRSNIGETPTITSQPVRFLIQSQADPFVPTTSFRYGDLRWHLGLIALERLPDLVRSVRPERAVVPPVEGRYTSAHTL